MIPVLIIDDDEDIRLILQSFLANIGHFEVHCADTAAAGLEAGQRVQPRLIILDYQLPDRRGDEVLPELLGDHGAKILVLSASRDQTTRDNLLQLGATAVHHKPFDPVAFVQMVEGLFAT